MADLDGEFSHWVFRRASLVPEDIDWPDFAGRMCPPNMQVFARDIQEEGAARIGREQMSHSDFASDGDADPRTFLMWGLAEASIRQELLRELPMRLQVERAPIFVEYDRIRSESELRAAIIVPLTLIIGFLVSASGLWLIALVAPLWLLRQAVQTHVDAEETLLSAVRHGVIESSTVAFLDSLVPREGKPA